MYMKSFSNSKTHHFYVVGLNYLKADAETRGRFSLDNKAMQNAMDMAKEDGLEAVMLMSTCNRTEVYGFAEHPYQLIKLICENSKGTASEFQQVGYIYKNETAIDFVFKVGTGLDSQILGDFEIISQIRNRFTESKNQKLTNTFLERLVNAVIQASKRIKNETLLSSGATSVSFASVQYILRNIENINQKKIILFGTGKIGRNTCENLVKHTENKNITLINRTLDKAQKIAGKFKLIVKSYGDLITEIQTADVLVVATGATNPTVDKDILSLKKPLLILDLSIPKNVHDNVLENPLVTVVHLDHLSQMTDETLDVRKKDIPKANNIIAEVKEEFLQWSKTRKFAPVIHALKEKLTEINQTELKNHRKKIVDFNEEQAEIIANRLISKITSHFAHHLKSDHETIDESIMMIEKVFQLETQVLS